MKAAVTTGPGAGRLPRRARSSCSTPRRATRCRRALRPRRTLRKGFTGKGVTVGVVDSGCDATQPDLADRVKHNVTLVSAEYANVTPDSSNTLVVPVDKGPYRNTDLGSGHGTHVAGIIAADSSSVDRRQPYGVAPGADLACFAIGQVLFTTAVVTAYDYMLDQPDMLGIDVVNNSWGNSYRQFDPRDPVAVATKAVADQGVTVVFAAGNSGAEDVSASLNPFSQSPWVISVAAGTLDRHRGDFSSNGLVYDNSQADRDRRRRAHDVHRRPHRPGPPRRHRAGRRHLLDLRHHRHRGRPVPARREHHRLGHLDGLAAHRRRGGRAQAGQPALTPTQVRQALQATATPVKVDGGTATAPFWQVGYGYANLDKAVALVRRSDWRTALAAAASRQPTRRALASDGQKVLRSDFWTYDAPRVDRRRLGHQDLHGPGRSRRREKLFVSVAHPSAGTVGANLFSYTVTVTDPKGKVVGTSTESPTAGSGTSTVLVDLRTLEVTGRHLHVQGRR